MSVEWMIAVGLLVSGLVGGVLVLGGKRDPSTRPYLPGFFRHPGSFFESRPRRDDDTRR